MKAKSLKIGAAILVLAFAVSPVLASASGSQGGSFGFFAGFIESFSRFFSGGQEAAVGALGAGPYVVSIKSDKSVISASGAGAKIEWNAPTATSCFAMSTPSSTDWKGPISASGSRNVLPKTTTRYYVGCYSPSGGNATSSLQIRVSPVTISASLRATAERVEWAKSARLTWSTKGADLCSAMSNPAHPSWTGDVPLQGTREVFPSATTTFTLLCSNPEGQMATSSVTIIAGQPSNARQQNEQKTGLGRLVIDRVHSQGKDLPPTNTKMNGRSVAPNLKNIKPGVYPVSATDLKDFTESAAICEYVYGQTPCVPNRTLPIVCKTNLCTADVQVKPDLVTLVRFTYTPTTAQVKSKTPSGAVQRSGSGQPQPNRLQNGAIKAATSTAN